MKKLILPLMLVSGLAMAPVAMAGDNADNKKGVVLKTSDGKEIRAVVHPEDAKHLDDAKKGDKIELFSMSGGFSF